MKKELVFRKGGFERKEEVMRFLREKVMEMGLGGAEVRACVMEREEGGGRCLGDYRGIPEWMTRVRDERFWGICRLEKRMIWGEKKVEFVCVGC
ncbi:PTS sugar transporter subunit IIA, partial [Bacillus sp. WP8]|uniref:PTS sugar transporter subunit IIA n=1 Tax=Bacillus sp. WP8 TaxID=756828 RepID=UPI001642DC09